MALRTQILRQYSLYILIHFTHVTSSLLGMRSVDSRCEFLNSIKLHVQRSTDSSIVNPDRLTN